MAEKNAMTSTPQREGQLTRRTPSSWEGSPWNMMQRFAEEMDRMFDDFGFGRRAALAPRTAGAELWAPQVDVFQRNHELVVTADHLQ